MMSSFIALSSRQPIKSMLAIPLMWPMSGSRTMTGTLWVQVEMIVGEWLFVQWFFVMWPVVCTFPCWGVGSQVTWQFHQLFMFFTSFSFISSNKRETSNRWNNIHIFFHSLSSVCLYGSVDRRKCCRSSQEAICQNTIWNNQYYSRKWKHAVLDLGDLWMKKILATQRLDNEI